MNTSELSARLELTCLRPDLAQAQLAACCRIALARHVRALCVPGSQIMQARHHLEDSTTKIVCPVGFPLGSSDSDVKRFETECAIDSGADEIEWVPNYGWIMDAQWDRIQREMRDVIEASSDHPVRLVLDCYILQAAHIQAILQMPTPREIQGVKCVKGLGAGLPDSMNLRLFLECIRPGWSLAIDGPLQDAAQGAALLAQGASCLSISAEEDLIDKLFSAIPDSTSISPV